MKTLLPFTEKTLNAIYADWLSIVNRKECGSIINISRSMQLYRINELFNHKTFLIRYLKNPKNRILVVDCERQMIDDENDLAVFLKKNVKNSTETSVFILDADSLIEHKPQLLAAFEDLHHKKAVLSILYFFQKNITYSHYSKRLSKYSGLYQNIETFPLFKKEDCLQFIYYLETKFLIKLQKDVKKEILNECGSNVWLLKECVRFLASGGNKKDLFTQDGIKMKLDLIFNSLDEIEKNNFSKIDQNLLSSPLFMKFVKSKLATNKVMKLNQNGEIILNNVLVSNIFSKKERILLRLLLTKNKQIVSRESIGNQIWKNENSFSDWALDQIIKRLRNKLTRLGIDKKQLKTVKNQGYIIYQ